MNVVHLCPCLINGHGFYLTSSLVWFCWLLAFVLFGYSGCWFVVVSVCGIVFVFLLAPGVLLFFLVGFFFLDSRALLVFLVGISRDVCLLVYVQIFKLWTYSKRCFFCKCVIENYKENYKNRRRNLNSDTLRLGQLFYTSGPGPRLFDIYIQINWKQLLGRFWADLDCRLEFYVKNCVGWWVQIGFYQFMKIWIPGQPATCSNFEVGSWKTIKN